MKRSEFEHAIRTAGSILGTNRLMVIGSQALHAAVVDELPDAAQRSVEVDIVAFDDTDEQKAESRASWGRRDVLGSAAVLVMILMAYLYFRG